MANVTVFAQQTRAAGTYTSASTTYSGKGVQGILTFTSSDWFTNTGVTVDTKAQYSFDSGATWQDAIEDIVTSGTSDAKHPGTIPQIGFEAGDSLGTRLVRVVMTLSASLNIGATASIS